jgi:hypothetical protein
MRSSRPHPWRALLLGVLATLALVGGAQAHSDGGAAPPAPATARSVVARQAIGSIDADVLDRSGRLLGHLRASVGGSDRGVGVLRSAPGRGVTQAVSVRVRGTTLHIAGQHGLRLNASIAKGGRLTGSGRLGSRTVRVRGVGGEQHPDLRRGMKMLVVGHPHGEAYRALLELYKPVRYGQATHTRAALLADRERYHGFAALVFGPDVSPRGIRSQRLLHAFYGTGKWVIVAPATTRAQAVLGTLHGYTARRPSAALAVRATGAAGSHDNVRPTVSFPAPTIVRSLAPGMARLRPSAAEERASAHRRAAWFRERLLELGRAHMRSASDPGDRQLQGADGSVNFALPYNAAAIQLAVPYYHEWTLTGSANGVAYGVLDPCGHDPRTHNSWCKETWAGKWGDPLSACDWYLANSQRMLEGPVIRYWGGLQSSGAYNIGTYPIYRPGSYGTFWQTFRQMPGKHQCIDNGTQTGNLQGTDYYYAIYDPALKQHTLVVLTDPTINASSTGTLVMDNRTNGTYEEWWFDYESSYSINRELKETMLFLGSYDHTIEIRGAAQLNDQVLEYSGNKSFPTNQITFSSQSTGKSTSESFGIGIFGDMATGSYDRTESHSASVTVNVPSWEITPVPGKRAISYRWATNDPLPWQTIADHNVSGGPYTDANASWGLNPINKVDFSPTSLTAWTGDQTYGQLSIGSTRQVRLVDHFSYYVPWKGKDGGPDDAFWVTNLEFADNPDTRTPNTKEPVGPGINLCDPLVRSPDFKADCGN